MLKLMYITNNPDVARIADGAGVDRIFVDLEQVGKMERQHNWDSVKSLHSVQDVCAIKSAVKNAEVLVRTDPVFDGLSEELEEVLSAKPDVVMLPFFKTVQEVERFLKLVDGRAKTSLLVETKEAVENLDGILSLGGIDEVHIGLNDLSHSYGLHFLFEPLANGIADKIVEKINFYGIKNYGIGGIAAIGKGLLPAEYIIPEHYRLGSTCSILSRAFCDTSKVTELGQVKEIFTNGVADIRLFEEKCSAFSEAEYEESRRHFINGVNSIVSNMVSKS